MIRESTIGVVLGNAVNVIPDRFLLFAGKDGRGVSVQRAPQLKSEYSFLNLSDPSAPFCTVSVRLIRCHDICLIYDHVHHSSHNKGSHHIKHGMLFDKHSRENNGNTQYKGADVQLFIPGKLLVVHDGQMSAYRIVHMDAWPEVRRSIHAVQMHHKAG